MFLSSKEGVTQGFHFSMVGYGLLVLPLIPCLQQEFPDVASPWYDDDAMAPGKLDQVMEYFRRHRRMGNNILLTVRWGWRQWCVLVNNGLVWHSQP